MATWELMGAMLHRNIASSTQTKNGVELGVLDMVRRNITGFRG